MSGRPTVATLKAQLDEHDASEESHPHLLRLTKVIQKDVSEMKGWMKAMGMDNGNADRLKEAGEIISTFITERREQMREEDAERIVKEKKLRQRKELMLRLGFPKFRLTAKHLLALAAAASTVGWAYTGWHSILHGFHLVP